MKKSNFLLLLLIIFYYGHPLLANGVCIIDAPSGSVFKLVSSDVKVEVTDQIATVTATSIFRNNSGADTKIKFGFPMTETASAISLRWENEGVWYLADFSPQPQDTTLPGGGGGGLPTYPSLAAFLGSTPLYFDLEQLVKADSFLTIELVYVDLLPYAFSKVSFSLGHDYTELQPEPVEVQHFLFTLSSQRTIELIELQSHGGASVLNNGNFATVEWQLDNQLANADYHLEYQLDADQLGIFPFSTYLADSAVICDEYGRGFFAFIIEPDPSENTQVIDKVFTLIIDRSGSMSGEKMIQARDAATFIVNNLNPGDYFNLVSFSDNISSFKPDHVPYNVTTQNEALAYIAELYASGSTNISGAFSEAIPDFSNANQNVANMIVFFTDGQATAGITSTDGILNHVQSLITINEVEGLSIFTFGIGNDANKQLLTLLANNNNGLSEFLESQELQVTISNFYLTIQNPVLLYPAMSFSPAAVYATHPQHLPNLFKGQQLILVGRYEEPLDVDVHFTGTAFGQPVNYDYTVSLADSTVQSLQFLPRLWAKQKMKDLYQDFFSYASGSPEAIALEDSIVNISLCYGVISPFTSFEDNSGNGGGFTETKERIDAKSPFDFFIAPNPFVGATVLYLTTDQDFFENAFVEIVDLNGRVVYTHKLFLGTKGNYQLSWNGNDNAGNTLPSGVYTVKISLAEHLVVGKVVKI
jgi:Ca-activated chloride channel homolog